MELDSEYYLCYNQHTKLKKRELGLIIYYYTGGSTDDNFL